jgi:hypothetical protein
MRIVYSGQRGPATGFSQFLLYDWKPRSQLALRFVSMLRTDPAFPRTLQTRSGMTFWLDRRRTLPWERRMAANAWRCYDKARRAAAAA